MKLLDVMATLEDLPETYLAKGQGGTIVDEPDKDVVLGEFADLGGVAYAEAISMRNSWSFATLRQWLPSAAGFVRTRTTRERP